MTLAGSLREIHRKALSSVLLLAVGALVIMAPTASAGTGIVRTVVNADGGVYWRASPPDWAAPVVNPGYGVYNGDQVELECSTQGSVVPPYNNNTLWYRATVVSGQGKGSGYVSDHFLDTGINQPNVVVDGVPPCDGGTGGGPPGVPLPTDRFDRAATVRWALAHAKDKPPYPASCTWFVSQALWAGGLPKSDAWTDAGQHGLLQKRPGSAAAWATPNFVRAIRAAFPRSTYTQLTFSSKTNAVPHAQVGDVIVYDWYGKSSLKNYDNLQHASLVTSIASGSYPQVSEWSIGDGREPSPYVFRGWTWSKLSNKWLQSKYPKIQAFLLHIDSGA
jgi:hypothetical protein